MRALIASCSKFTNFDGKSMRLIKYADVLLQMGYEVDFLVLDSDVKDPRYSIFCVDVPVHDYLGDSLQKPRLPSLSNTLRLFRFGFEMVRMMRQNRYQIVLTTLVSPEIAQIFGVIGARLTGARHLYDYDDLAPEMTMVMKGKSRFHPMVLAQLLIERITCSNSARTIAMSDMMKDRIIRAAPPEKIEVIYNAPFYEDVEMRLVIPTRERLGLDTGMFIFCFIGNIQGKIRGLEALVEAAEIVARSHPFQILLVGDGVGVPPLKRRIHERGLEDYFVFTGPIDRFQTIEYANAATVSCVLLPDSELGDYMVPGKLFISMGLGKQIIATKNAQLQRVLGDRAIYVQPNPTGKELAGAMFESMRRYSPSEQNMEFVQDFKEKYNWNIERIKFEEIILSLQDDGSSVRRQRAPGSHQ